MISKRIYESACGIWIRGLAWAFAIAAIVAALFITCAEFGITDGLEAKSYDLRLSLNRRALKGSGQNVAMLYVDEAALSTLREMGISWPMPRELYGSAISFCKRAGARALLFDIIFSEDSSFGVADDLSFAESLSSSEIPTYFVLFASSHEGDISNIDDVLQRSSVPFAGEFSKLMPEVKSFGSLPVDSIRASATAFGNAQTLPDRDSIYRRVPLLMHIGKRVVPQVSVKIASDLLKVNELSWKDRYHLKFGASTIPLDKNGRMMISYIGGVDSYPAYSLADVLVSEQEISEGKTPRLDPALLEGKVVIIGLAAPGLLDLKPMPLSRVYPGPEIHATIIDSLLRGNFIRPTHGTILVTTIFLLSLLAAIGLTKITRPIFIISWIIGLLIIYVGSAFALFSIGIWIQIVPPVGALALSSFLSILRSYLLEGRKRQAIKRAFGQYLSPAVVGEIAKDPDNLKMGGEEGNITVFFSDIANFTTISEGMTPTELVEKLNVYLTYMSRIITEKGGTLDKYIGDAVMAFWGAPLKISDHALKGVQSAMAIQEVLKEMPLFITRIGIHTGRAVVGNIGSDIRFNYTAIGDTVNLASRLEGINKQFGTRIIISATTHEEVKGSIESRLIGKVRVKGRVEPIAIYEPLGLVNSLEAQRREYYDHFAFAMEKFMKGEFAGAKVSFIDLCSGDDPVVAYYIDVCDKFLVSPPDGEFDGVITLKTK